MGCTCEPQRITFENVVQAYSDAQRTGDNVDVRRCVWFLYALEKSEGLGSILPILREIKDPTLLPKLVDVKSAARMFQGAHRLNQSEVVDCCVAFVAALERKKRFGDVIEILREMQKSDSTLVPKFPEFVRILATAFCCTAKMTKAKTTHTRSSAQLINTLAESKGFDSIVPIVCAIERTDAKMVTVLQSYTMDLEWNSWQMRRAAIAVTQWLQTESGLPLFPTDLIQVISSHCQLSRAEWRASFLPNILDSGFPVGLALDCRRRAEDGRWNECTIYVAKREGETVTIGKRDYFVPMHSVVISVKYKDYGGDEWRLIGEDSICNCAGLCEYYSERPENHKIAIAATQSKLQDEAERRAHPQGIKHVEMLMGTDGQIFELKRVYH